MDIGRIWQRQGQTKQRQAPARAKARAKAKASARTARTARTARGQDKDKSKDKNKDSVECWNCGKRRHYPKDCWSKKNTKGGSTGKTQTPRMQMLTILTRNHQQLLNQKSKSMNFS